MAFDTWTPPRAPSIDSQVTREPRLITSQLGDGYQATTPDGLNAYPTSYTMVLTPLTLSQLQSANAFLTAHLGMPFYWTMPEESSPRLWLAGKTSQTHLGGMIFRLEIPLTERFDPNT